MLPISFPLYEVRMWVMEDLEAPMNRKGLPEMVHSTQKSRVVSYRNWFICHHLSAFMWMNELWQSYLAVHSKYYVSVT